MTARAAVSVRLTVPVVLVALALAAAVTAAPAPPKPSAAAVNPAAVAPVRPPVKMFPDLVVLLPTLKEPIPASGSNPAGTKVVWNIKNQGSLATANRVKLVLSCQPVAGHARGPLSPQEAAQICFSLNNYSYLSYPGGQPPSTPVPLAPGQVSEDFATLSSTAAASCMTWHAKVTATADADNKYDEGPIGEANNTRVFEICEMRVIQR